MAKSKGFASKSSGGSGLLPWLSLALIIILLDQFTKVLILGYYQLGDSTVVTSFFNVVRVHNSGAAFSFLASAGGWQRWLFTGIGVAAALFIVWMLKSHGGQKIFCFALALILGGAIGSTATWWTSSTSTTQVGTSPPSTWPTAASAWARRCSFLTSCCACAKAESLNRALQQGAIQSSVIICFQGNAESAS
jgi:hypothetical protein